MLRPLLLVLLLSPLGAAAQDYEAGDIRVDNPVAFATPRTAMTGAGYLSITNTGGVADRLVAVEAAFPRVMVHDTEVTDGVSRMVHLDGLTIDAGTSVVLQPGGKHVMFMGLNGDPFEVGESFPAALVFERAGRLEVTFTVVERGSVAGAMDHDGHEGVMDHGGADHGTDDN